MPSAVPLGLRVEFRFEVVVGVETAAVVPIVLHEAEVDRHLAHRAGHALSPPLCGGSADDCQVPAIHEVVTPAFGGIDHIFCCGPTSWRRYPSLGRTPSTAVPTRTCVAPAATACSRSALIPADTMLPPGGLGAGQSTNPSTARTPPVGVRRTPR